jgi:arsenate reductase-like glutaredoxin family protein
LSQQSGAPLIDTSLNTERASQQEMSQREYQLRNVTNQTAANTDRRKIQALMAQTQGDFETILNRHNEFARVLTANKALDYRSINDLLRYHHSR